MNDRVIIVPLRLFTPQAIATKTKDPQAQVVINVLQLLRSTLGLHRSFN